MRFEAPRSAESRALCSRSRSSRGPSRLCKEALKSERTCPSVQKFVMAYTRPRSSLASVGPVLPFPHSSKVMGDPGGSLRELRPRAGRSPWRCIYERIGEVFVIGAVGPEAQKDKAGFERAVSAAKARLAEIEP